MNELNPCPFCGGELEWHRYPNADCDDNGYYSCGCEESWDGAIDEDWWNTRPIEDKLQSRINKACEMALQEMGVYADAELKDLPESLVAFRNVIDVLQGKGE